MVIVTIYYRKEFENSLWALKICIKEIVTAALYNPLNKIKPWQVQLISIECKDCNDIGRDEIMLKIDADKINKNSNDGTESISETIRDRIVNRFGFVNAHFRLGLPFLSRLGVYIGFAESSYSNGRTDGIGSLWNGEMSYEAVCERINYEFKQIELNK